MTTKPIPETKARFWRSGQAVHYEAYYNVEGRVVRVEIKRDSSIAQSYVRAVLFDGNKWNHLCSIPAEKAKIEEFSPYAPSITVRDFQPDETAVLQIAQAVLAVGIARQEWETAK